eukprot:3514443-Amphidinium_carterae.1
MESSKEKYIVQPVLPRVTSRDTNRIVLSWLKAPMETYGRRKNLKKSHVKVLNPPSQNGRCKGDRSTQKHGKRVL